MIVEARPRGEEPEGLLAAALRGGVDIVQLREKRLDDDAIVAAGRVFRRLCDAHGALFIVNDRPDLAAACDADGVHLGQDDLPLAEARRLLGPEALIGLSTHSRDEIEAAAGADYIGVGPVWKTPTKGGHPPVGLGLVGLAARIAPVPFFAIGGISAERAREAAAAGAQRIAVVRAIRDAPDPEAAARALRSALEAHAPARAG